MGVLPLEFPAGQSRETLGLDGTETFAIETPPDVRPLQSIRVTATKGDGTVVAFDAKCRIDTPVEIDYYRNGGILHYVLRQLAKN
jgi:aconitate hydratase